MSARPQETTTAPDELVAAGSIPMMAQVYVRLRHRLREVESLLQDSSDQPVEHDLEHEQADAERAVLQAKAATLRSVLERAAVVPIGSRAIVGSRVYVRSDDKDHLEQYEIVVSIDADPALGRVSFDSPLGAALLGREVGDVTTMTTRRGQRELTVMAIAHE